MTSSTPVMSSWCQRLLIVAISVVSLTAGGCGLVHHSSEPEQGWSQTSDSQVADDSTSSGELTYIPRDVHTERSASNNAISDDNEDSDEPAAQDDATWQAFHQAEEFCQMGVLANRESSWEEAQYYFEKALKTLANVEVDTDSSLTPEAVKYNTLLDNIISDYRITLRSLGKLDEDAAPSAIVERFGDLETKLGNDSMHVYKSERGMVSYDLPVVMNSRVKASIVYFQTVANEAFRRYLGRSQKYAPMFKRILRENGLPEDLIYLSLVESGYNPHAYSFARAVGLWQFIASTGKLYGLERTWWIDERRDPEKSTEAAAKFLKELYESFGSWELAMAAYNGGPGRVERTIASQRTSDFWKMRLRQQTMDYVPLIYAAIIIAKEPEKYGFGDVTYEPELTFDTVMIDRCLDLRTIAQRLGCTVDTLKFLNPELLRNYTPPNTRQYKLRIPSGARSHFLAVYDELPEAAGASFAHHKVRRRESLASIANRYGVTQYAILEANNLPKGARVKSGMDLIIPISDDGSERSSSGRSSAPTKAREYKTEKSIYTVRPGDTMWDIARGFGISTEELRQVNYLGKNDRLAVGQRLRIPSYVGKAPAVADLDSDAADSETHASAGDTPTSRPSAAASSPSPRVAADKSSGSGNVYVVRPGDSIWEIAKRFGTSAAQIREQNGLGKEARIYIGQRLSVPAAGASSAGQYVVYKVRTGDTLGRIAQKYKTTVARLVADNSLDDPESLKPGDRIKIFTE